MCDCFSGANTCGQTCVEKALIEESVYYPIACVPSSPGPTYSLACGRRTADCIPSPPSGARSSTHLYNNLTHLYPHAQIWLTGHSLGGALASLLGVTFGAPTVAFESPGDRLAARRLHLPLPPGMGGETVTHVYHTAGPFPLALLPLDLSQGHLGADDPRPRSRSTPPADPIPNGACTGKLSSCYAAGFALEARCHLGQTVLYDTVNELGWSVDVRTHSSVPLRPSALPPASHRLVSPLQLDS